MSTSYNISKSISSSEDNQTFVFDITINNEIVIREVINNRSGFIRIPKKIKFKKVENIVCKLLDLKFFKEYTLSSLNISENNLLVNDKYCIKLENYQGYLTIFYHIN